MNEYEIKVTFFDDDGHVLETEVLTPKAKDTDDAYEQIEEEIEKNQDIYPSDDYNTQLIDVH